VDKLKSQMAAKKEEQTALELLSEKDLWCKDLDAFVDEWELQLKEEADYQKTIRNTNRRASRKIGAGKAAGKAKKADDDYAPKAKKAAPKITKVEPKKSSANFLDAFSKKKPATKPGFGKDSSAENEDVQSSAAAGLSDDDFDALMAIKPSRSTSQTSRAPSEQPVASGRAKRAAAVAPKKWAIEDDEESESDDDRLLGNIGDMVKGIGGGGAADNANGANGRVSLFAMSRPDSSHGRSTSNDLPKVKSKPSKTFDISDEDETNYEMLARSSPQKAPSAPKDNLDSFLSMDDDDDILPLPKKVSAKATTAKPAAKKAPKAKPAAKPAPAARKVSEPKPVALSPAAKAYAAKQKKATSMKNVFSEDELDGEDVEEEEEEEDDSLPPQPAARGRGRPARAAAAVKPKQPVYTIDSEDDSAMDVDDIDESAVVEDEPSEDFDESE
jgi:DNA topoisomerase-2